jgi:hypothetical protein
MKEILIMDTRRNGYSPDQCNKTITVGELIEILSEYDEDTEIYTSHDKGYTYGNITSRDFETMDTDGEEEGEC